MLNNNSFNFTTHNNTLVPNIPLNMMKPLLSPKISNEIPEIQNSQRSAYSTENNKGPLKKSKHKEDPV